VKSWALPAAAIVALEYAAALSIGYRVGFHYSIPFGSYLVLGLTVATIGFWLIIAARLVRRDFAKSLPWGFVAGSILVALQMAVLNWTKIMLPIAVGFWADAPLAEADQLVFGTDAWRVLQPPFAFLLPSIDVAYMTWAPLKFAVLLFLVAMPETPLKSGSLLSYFMIMLTGAIGQYALPSAGPLFYQDIPLQPWVAEGKAYLWQDYLRGGGNIGTGISAMPSIHVAIALWMAIVLRLHLPRLAPAGLIYFALIFIGSVVLGWHYAMDAFAGAGVTLLAFAATRQAGRFTAPKHVTVSA